LIEFAKKLDWTRVAIIKDSSSLFEATNTMLVYKLEAESIAWATHTIPATSSIITQDMVESGISSFASQEQDRKTQVFVILSGCDGINDIIKSLSASNNLENYAFISYYTTIEICLVNRDPSVSVDDYLGVWTISPQVRRSGERSGSLLYSTRLVLTPRSLSCRRLLMSRDRHPSARTLRIWTFPLT
jgi:hypothetical protein